MIDRLRLHDSLSSTVREFVPAGPEVKLYVCGVTPYDTTHLGHAFTYISFDVLVRYLEFLGFSVRYIQNVTDVDDPLFAKARELRVPYEELAARETQRYLEDMAALNVRPAAFFPRASSEIESMVDIARTLVKQGAAYDVEGHVYFRIKSDPRYGELSKYDREAMLETARERGGDPDDPRKEDPLDFLLWRPSGQGEPEFESPWGPGLPGWHLECSAISLKYLGAPLDIHGGGADLLYPHHESEIAESEAASGVRPFARFWMHTAMVFMGGEKMSKSLGNMVFARDLVRSHGANSVRLYVSSVHYRSELHWDPADLEIAAFKASKLQEAAVLETSGRGTALNPERYRERFAACMNDDLNTPGAVSVLLELGEAIRDTHANGGNITEARAVLRSLGGILGLQLVPPIGSSP